MYPGEPPPTAWDLNFNLFGVQVRVHPLFWLISILFGYSLIDAGRFDLLGIWVVCVFVSILVHELGHVLMGRAFGSSGRVVMYSFGGLAVGSTQSLSRWQRVLVLFAGPGAGFILCAAVWSARVIASDFGTLPFALRFAVVELIYINLWWGLINLLPVWPLDGGQISGEVCSSFRPRGGLRLALQISIVVGAVIAVIGFTQYMKHPILPINVPGLGLYAALLFAYLAYGSYELLQQIPRDPWQDESRMERAPWERDPDEWRRR